LGASLLKLPFLQIKRYDLYGLRPSELPAVESFLREKGKLLLLLGEESLLKELNHLFSNRFKGVELRRTFTAEGVEVSLRFLRRKPYALLKSPEGDFLVDEGGNLFKDEGASAERLLKVRKLTDVKKRWPVLKGLLSFSGKVQLKEDRTVLKEGGRSFYLPPLEMLSSKHLKLLRFAKEKAREGKEIDLRYKSFILLR